MPLFWLSFTDGSQPTGQQFQGVTLIEADDLKGAVSHAWATGSNPGGQVLSVELDLNGMSNQQRLRLAQAPRDMLLDKELLLHYDLINEDGD